MKIQVYEISPQELIEQITICLKKEMKEFILGAEKKSKTPDYLSRKEVCILLKIDPSTLYRWTKDGYLKSYGIGNRVYYLKDDIQQVLLNNQLNVNN